MPSVIQTAFALEACSNLVPIISLSFFPVRTLSYFLASPSPSLELNGTTVFLARSVGLLILALTPQLLLAYPNGEHATEKRKLVYWTLGSGEVALIPLLLWEAFREADERKAAGVWEGGLTRRFCLIAVTNLVPVLAWRFYVFFVKPHWFGNKEDVSEKVKKSK